MTGWRLGCVLAAFCGSQALAQSATPESNTELSKETENPVARRITLPLRYEANINDGPYGATEDTYELDQAILPITLNDDWALITRTKLPAYSQPPKKLDESWQSGLGNGYTTFFLSPEQGRDFYWGVGPVLYYPSATNAALGIHRWGSGPSLGFVRKGQSPWVFGAVVNNIWSFGGPASASDRINELLLNPFISYHFGDGWAVASSPNITANWLSAAGQQWTVPIGGGVSKTFRLGRQPMRLSVDSFYNAIRPKAGQDEWLAQITLTFIFSR
jgi:hypothetical protein